MHGKTSLNHQVSHQQRTNEVIGMQHFVASLKTGIYPPELGLQKLQ